MTDNVYQWPGLVAGTARLLYRTGLAAILLGLLPLYAAPAQADDRALLIGVGDYQNSHIRDLPGIGFDLETMRELASQFGYRQLRVLGDQQATYRQVEQGLREWLVDGVGPDDRILIYFSGHGSFIPDDNGDEADGRDEVLMLHDSKPVARNGVATLANVLDDDQFGRLLAALPSRHVLVIVDACFSGTVTRSVDFPGGGLASGELVTKSYSYPGMPARRRGGTDRSWVGKGVSSAVNYVLLSAAAEDEESLAGLRGSLFTLGLAHALDEARKDHDPLTPARLHEQSRDYVLAALRNQPDKLYHPQIDGSDVLAGQPLAPPADTRTGSNRARYQALQGKPLRVRSNRRVFQDGDALRLDVDIPTTGYLNIISIGPDDQATLLYPNNWDRDNEVEPGTLSLPTAAMRSRLTAGPPHGRSLVIALLTTKALNFYRVAGQLSKAPEHFAPDFAPSSDAALRAFRAEAKPGVWVGQLELRVCPLGGCR